MICFNSQICKAEGVPQTQNDLEGLNVYIIFHIVLYISRHSLRLSVSNLTWTPSPHTQDFKLRFKKSQGAAEVYSTEDWRCVSTYTRKQYSHLHQPVSPAFFRGMLSLKLPHNSILTPYIVEFLGALTSIYLSRVLCPPFPMRSTDWRTALQCKKSNRCPLSTIAGAFFASFVWYLTVSSFTIP